MSERIVVVGEARIDEVRDEHGARETVAGAGADLARRLARRGHGVVLLTPLADDEDGRRIRVVMEDHRVRVLPLDAPAGTGRRRVVIGAGRMQEHGQGTVPFTGLGGAVAGLLHAGARADLGADPIVVVTEAELVEPLREAPVGVVDASEADPRVLRAGTNPDRADRIADAVRTVRKDAVGGPDADERLARALARIAT